MSTSSDPNVAKLLSDLAALQAALSAILLSAPANVLPAEEERLVPLKIAAAVWGISPDAAIRRARRRHGVKRFGRWYFPESVVYPTKSGSAA